MENRKFKFWNRVVSFVVLVVASFTYLSTIEPTASFWDCGEFIASSYKLEVGHPPGNPVFQLIARLCVMFVGPEHAALAVNSMSAILSALTIFLLYLTLVFFVKRLVGKGRDETYSLQDAIVIMGSSAVGALAYCFSDTFWFSAVEGEVYAMSSFFTALVFWVMTKWYDCADEPHSSKWIVLIALLTGLSIGIHLLNLLTIPALVFMYYYRMQEDKKFSFWELVKIFAIGVVILALVYFVIVPYFPRLAAFFDRIFVNVFGLPYNSGAAFFVLLVLALSFWGLFYTLKKNQVFANTVLLCFTSIVIGFSLFAIVIIRSEVKTPTNEYQPDNPYTLVRYLSREQYGSTPLIYGQYFDAPYDLAQTSYWAPLYGKYVKVDGTLDADYHPEGKMLFPRMWSSDENHISYYETYMTDKNGRIQGKRIKGATHKKPSMAANLSYFFDYQLNWMYLRYFMWNFAGRQNDIHAPSQDRFYGNWECGIPFIDEARLGDQSLLPTPLKENKGKNHYFLLPLILGILGIFFQYEKDRRGSWLVFLMFFMTGIAIVIYLNQPPYQVRERDYAYAGSFYMFCVWIGIGVAAIYSWLRDLLKGRGEIALACGVSLLCLSVPALMAQQNWDDHDRSNRATSVEMAKNYLNSVGENGILITHGDNDTFPLWYAQEVEEYRTDVRIVNTSLLGTDWHIDQMRYAVNESAPLSLGLPQRMYLYGTNEFIYVIDDEGTPMLIQDVLEVFKDPMLRVPLASGRNVDFICSRKIIVPVNKENVLRYGILDEQYADLIPDHIVLEMSQGKNYITKQELFILDFLSQYQWDRPLNMLNMGGDLNVGIKDYLMYDGFSYRLIPIKNSVKQTNPGLVNSLELYDKMVNDFSWDALKRTDYFVDYQNYYTFLGVLNQRAIFLNVANALMADGHNDKALEILDLCLESVPEENYPLESICLGFTSNDYYVAQIIRDYFKLGESEKATALAERFLDALQETVIFYASQCPYYLEEFMTACQYGYLVTDILENSGEKEVSAAANGWLDMISGEITSRYSKYFE